MTFDFFLRQDPICIPMHLYGPYTFIWENVENSYFGHLLWRLWSNWVETWWGASGHLVGTKIAKTATATILKVSFWHLFPNLWSILAETCSVVTGQLLDQTELKPCRSEIKDGRHSRHSRYFKNLFWTSRKPQGELSWNLQLATGWRVDEKELKSCRLEIQNGRHCLHLEENQFLMSPPKPLGDLSWNTL